MQNPGLSRSGRRDQTSPRARDTITVWRKSQTRGAAGQGGFRYCLVLRAGLCDGVFLTAFVSDLAPKLATRGKSLRFRLQYFSFRKQDAFVGRCAKEAVTFGCVYPTRSCGQDAASGRQVDWPSAASMTVIP